MDEDYDKKLNELKSKLKSYPNFPRKGILFWDIFAALSDGAMCKLLQSLLVRTVKEKYPDAEAVIGLESRGFLFAFSLAAELELPCVPVRKPGKLPGEVYSYKYELEYGTDVLQIQCGSIRPDMKCIIVDDLIATGGTMGAAVNLIRECNGKVSGCLAVMELKSLNGRAKVPVSIPVHSLIKFD